jgi:hypothetical protein
MYTRKVRGITLLEIMVALLILAFAFLPIFGMIGTSTKDTDISESYIFAHTMTRNILNSLLDDVPFYAIGVADGDIADMDGEKAEPNVGELFDLELADGQEYEIASFLRKLGNNGDDDNYTRGELTDDRGFKYQVKIFVFPVEVHDPFDLDNDVTFRYMPRPEFETQPDWYTTTPEAASAFIQAGDSPYQMDLPDPIVQGAKELGAREGPHGNNYCVMKKILIRIRWGIKGRERSVEVYTMKANLDRESI